MNSTIWITYNKKKREIIVTNTFGLPFDKFFIFKFANLLGLNFDFGSFNCLANSANSVNIFIYYLKLLLFNFTSLIPIKIIKTIDTKIFTNCEQFIDAKCLSILFAITKISKIVTCGSLHLIYSYRYEFPIIDFLSKIFHYMTC